jgi:hypothetical protein
VTPVIAISCLTYTSSTPSVSNAFERLNGLHRGAGIEFHVLKLA